MPDPIVTLLSTMAMTIALFGSIYCFIQRRDRLVYGALALFLLSNAITEFGIVFAPLTENTNSKLLFHSTWIIGITTVAPLLWVYVTALTVEVLTRPKRLYLHFLFPILATISFTRIIVFSDHLEQVLAHSGGITDSQNYFSGAPLEGIFLLIPLQWLIYLTMTWRHLRRYRTRLRDLFASTENHEMRWINVLMLLYVTSWLLPLAAVFSNWALRTPMPPILSYLINLTLIGVMTLWGIRQRPVASGSQTPAPQQSYAKSALPPEMIDRIAGKLRRAMYDERLFLNPNISLSILARHIGASQNYISQVLSVEIGENFFDFVNGYRVREAQKLLHGTDATILQIAMDVGFNARSSFYTAFKRHTGVTPSEYRKSLS